MEIILSSGTPEIHSFPGTIFYFGGVTLEVIPAQGVLLLDSPVLGVEDLHVSAFDIGESVLFPFTELIDADAFKRKKNLPANQPLYLYTIYDYDGTGVNLYFCSYPESVEYQEITYEPFPIAHEAVGENAQGQVDKVVVRVSNVNRQIQGYLENYDLRGKKVRILTVFADLLQNDDAYLEDLFYVEDYVATEEVVEFNLSSRFDILGIELPLRRYSRNFCGWRFKGTECAYAGAEATCNKTLQRCRELENEQRFGGFPSIPYKRLIV